MGPAGTIQYQMDGFFELHDTCDVLRSLLTCLFDIY